MASIEAVRWTVAECSYMDCEAFMICGVKDVA